MKCVTYAGTEMTKCIFGFGVCVVFDVNAIVQIYWIYFPRRQVITLMLNEFIHTYMKYFVVEEKKFPLVMSMYRMFSHDVII